MDTFTLQSEMVTLAATFGLSLFISNLAIILFTGNPVGVNYSPGTLQFGYLHVPIAALYVAILSVLIITGTWLFLERTFIGSTIRAYAQDVTATELVGANPAKVASLATALGFAVTMAGGALLTVWIPVGINPLMGALYAPISFVIVVLGGPGKMWGSLVGGLTLGVVGLGALLGLVFALGIGLVILRFRGVYFAITTVVLVLAAYNIVLQFPQLGAGGEIIVNLKFQPLATYFTIWTIVLIEIVLTYYVNRSRIGFGIRAIKNEEDAASAVGVSPRTMKLTGYMLGGLFGGAAGAVYAWSISGVTAGPAFDFTFSLVMLAMIIIGGVGTSIGPLLGAVVVYIPSYFLLTTVAQAQPLIIGLLVIIMALFLPEGIVGLLRRSNEHLRLVLE